MINRHYLRLWGPISNYSGGTAVIMADRQILRALENGTAHLDDSMGNAKAVVTYKPTGKWFLISGGWGNNEVYTAMMGAICGDVVGSVYERNNIKHKPNQRYLVRQGSRFTDDTVMTCAVAAGLLLGLSKLPKKWMDEPHAERLLFQSVKNAMIDYGRSYPYAGYGQSFRDWLLSDDPRPYNSWGNGSAMRASYAGWVAQSLEEAEKLGEITASVTHNHPEGLKGAKVVAGCIFLLRETGSKETIRAYAEQYYDLSFTLDGIREDYVFDVSCAGTVPQAIAAFLEGKSFTDVIASAISIGGDSDTLAAIAGSLAEVIYPIPQDLRGRVIDRVDPLLLNTIAHAVDFFEQRFPG